MATNFTPLPELYRDEVVPALVKEFNYSSVMQAPKITKVVVNVGLGEALDNAKAIEFATNDITTITGQKSVLNKAKSQSPASAARRTHYRPEGDAARRSHGAFLTRLIHRSLAANARLPGNIAGCVRWTRQLYAGVREQLIFPEIDYDKIDKIRGMEVTIVTTAPTDEEGRRLLALMGMPFKREVAEAA